MSIKNQIYRFGEASDVALSLPYCILKEMKDLIKEEMSADITVTPEGIVELTLGGNVSSDLHADELREWTTKAASTIINQREKNGGEVYVITNIGGLSNFDEGAVNIMKEFVAQPEMVNVRSAVLGGSMFSKMALRSAKRSSAPALARLSMAILQAAALKPFIRSPGVVVVPQAQQLIEEYTGMVRRIQEDGKN